jgi:hypothetical protein
MEELKVAEDAETQLFRSRTMSDGSLKRRADDFLRKGTRGSKRKREPRKHYPSAREACTSGEPVHIGEQECAQGHQGDYKEDEEDIQRRKTASEEEEKTRNLRAEERKRQIRTWAERMQHLGEQIKRLQTAEAKVAE